MTELNTLKAEMDALRGVYEAAKARYEKALCEAQPIRVGDVIRSASGQLAKVQSIYVRSGLSNMTAQYIVAVMRNKDGTFGKRPVPMWHMDWDNPEVVKE